MAIVREHIDAFDAAPLIMKAFKPGVLLTTKAGDTVNTMTIGWGMVGVEWRKPIFIAYVRTDRYTHELLAQSDAFTVNVPLATDDADERRRIGQIVARCGRTSGRDLDKFADCSLTQVPAVHVEPPALSEFPLTLECRIIYRRDQDLDLMPQELRASVYPDDPSVFHTAYYGEILDSYIVR